ncbi:hypothetical protein AR275_20585 [Stenotrophomonas maltophilia]|nr:hypothetical protein AR275_20585 [Stenotrophomonas maltophilia]
MQRELAKLGALARSSAAHSARLMVSTFFVTSISRPNVDGARQIDALIAGLEFPAPSTREISSDSASSKVLAECRCNGGEARHVLPVMLRTEL